MESKMFKRLIPILGVLAVLLSACGPQGTPTMAPADVQNTAVAAAWTMVAMTNQAIPTITPLPPTETPSPTPLPTFTPIALPTIMGSLPTPTTQPVSSDPDSCIKPLDTGEAGPTVRVRLENEAGGAMNVSLNLWTPNAFGQCGAISTTLGKNESSVLDLPKGSWWHTRG